MAVVLFRNCRTRLMVDSGDASSFSCASPQSVVVPTLSIELLKLESDASMAEEERADAAVEVADATWDQTQDRMALLDVNSEEYEEVSRSHMLHAV